MSDTILAAKERLTKQLSASVALVQRMNINDVQTLLAELSRLEGENAEAIKDRKAADEHVLRVAAEARDGLAALEEIDACWDAYGTAGNRKNLSLSEQVASTLRELEDALHDYGNADSEAKSAEADNEDLNAALAEARRQIAERDEANERLRDKLLVVENDVMSKAQDIYIGEICARQAAESVIPIAFKAGWEATKTGNFHVAGGRETACKMFLDGFDFADEDSGEDLSIPQKPICFQGAVERGAEAVWKARYAHAIGKARATPWSEAADSQRAALLVEADACIRAALAPPSTNGGEA